MSSGASGSLIQMLDPRKSSVCSRTNARRVGGSQRLIVALQGRVLRPGRKAESVIDVRALGAAAFKTYNCEG